MATKNFWHIQLHPNNRADYSRDDIFKIVSDNQIIGMGESWDKDGGQPNHFKNSAKIGDIVMVRHCGPLCLVEIAGECLPNSSEVWFDICRKIKILGMEGEKMKETFKKDWKEGLFMAATFQPANNSPFVKFWYEQIITH